MGDGKKADGGDASTGGDAAIVEGGELTLAQTVQPDALDPALSYGTGSWVVMHNVYSGLLGYPHKPGAEGLKVMPALAEAMPEISAGRGGPRSTGT